MVKDAMLHNPIKPTVFHFFDTLLINMIKTAAFCPRLIIHRPFSIILKLSSTCVSWL